MMKPKDYLPTMTIDWPRYFTEPKFDGIRGYYYQGRFLSYNHKPIYNAESILETMAKLKVPPTKMIDGEFYSVEGGWERTLSILKSSKTKKPIQDVKFYAFDLTRYERAESFEDDDDLTLWERKDDLQFIYKQAKLYQPARPHTELVWHGFPRTKQDFLRHFNAFVENGFEGIMLKDSQALYEWGKRSAVWLRLKKTHTEDVTIESMNKGREGKYSKTLGSLLCRDKNGQVINVSGMSDELRDEMWKHKKQWLKKIIEVKFYKRTKQNHMYSAQYVRRREDK